jgi:hypothetical protein
VISTVKQTDSGHVMPPSGIAPSDDIAVKARAALGRTGSFRFDFSDRNPRS